MGRRFIRALLLSMALMLSTVVVSFAAAGNAHTAVLKNDGTLWAWGFNGYGQLGDGTTVSKHSPDQVGTASDWTGVTAGLLYTAAIKSDGTLWAWGYGSEGQLGDGNRAFFIPSPAQVGTARDWMSVTAGYLHTAAIKSDGTLWAWGYNDYGQLGDGSNRSKYSPVQVGTANDWTSVSAGHLHTVAIKSDGTLWAWGYNEYGQLGDGTTGGKSSPVQVGTANDWTSVTTKYLHTVAIKSDGTLWAWGYNEYGQLGDGTTAGKSSPVQVGTANDWTSVTTGYLHTVALKGDRTLWSWGNNNEGQLGVGYSVEFSNRPVQVGSECDWGSVAAGDYHTTALKSDGTLLTWGYNWYGALGDGTTNRSFSPIVIMADVIDARYSLTVEMADSSSGTITPNSGELLWESAKGSAIYSSGTDITLTATPNIGSNNTSWGGACSGTNSTCTVSMNRRQVVYAIFGADITPPTITTFSMPVTTGLVAPISLHAIDYLAVTGYLLKTSVSKPLATAPGWQTIKPTSYTFTSGGGKTLYAFVKDAAGNVSDYARSLSDLALASIVSAVCPA